MHVQEPSDFVVSEEGKRAQTKLWVNNHLWYYRITDKPLFTLRTLWLTSWSKRIHQYRKLLKSILRLPYNNDLTSYRYTHHSPLIYLITSYRCIYHPYITLN
jgi:hypothetical protein